MNNQFSGYVLAGGKSSRMGANKAFLEFGGKTFLERAVAALNYVCENRVSIVVNEIQFAEYYRKFPQFEYVFDVFTKRGALGGIHAALRDCKTDFAIILAIDLPLVGAGAIEKLGAFALAADDFSAIVPRQNDGRVQPLCAAYRTKNCRPALEKILSKSENSSVRDFLAKIETEIIESAQLSAEPDLLANFNFPQDLEIFKSK